MSGMNAAVNLQDQIDAKNSQFWDELCGTGLAKSLGISDFSNKSLSTFDDWYFRLYPYLKKYLNAVPLGASVLEIGLGYGTASGYLAQRAGVYHGLDISTGPVEVVNLRLQELGKPNNARQGSAHALPFANESLDAVVSIGCFHHTGSIEKCVNEAYRVLKPGGTLVFMCYNRRSLRMLLRFPLSVFSSKQDPIRLTASGAALYDVNSESDSAPFTEIGTADYYEKLCAKFNSYESSYENWEGSFRNKWLQFLGRFFRLDVYLLCGK